MEAAELNLFDLFAKITLDTSDYDDGVERAGKAGDGLATKLKSGLATAGKIAATGIGAIATAAGAAVGGLLALEQSTEGYRQAMGRLNTAFEAAGFSADTAQQAYQGFYGILGDTDTATEASQLLAQLALNAEDVSTWTEIAAGVNGTFGDSLPIEGLIEASNETAKVGQVTGVLADALNWAGINEDEFNEKLAACSDESERNQLIMETLSGQYDEASDAFYRNNSALVQSRMNQAQMDQTLAALGQTVSNVKNRLVSEFLPSISNVATAFSGLISGAQGADQAFAVAVQGLVSQAVSLLPQFLDVGVQILSSLASGIVQAIPKVVAAVPEVIGQLLAAISELLPQVLDMGLQILDQMTVGIEQGLPDMVSRLPQVIDEFLNFMTENLPTILQKGVEILTNLTDGIIQTIPEMVAALPQIITSFVNFISENLPEIVATGVLLLVRLIAGIISAIPQLIAALPQIIDAIANGLVALAGSIVETGVQLLQKLWDGIKSWLSNLKNNMSQIIDAIVDGISGGMGKVVEIGKNIVEGLWQGIQNMGSWIGDKVGGFFGGIVDGAKGLLGIASPSKVFAEMGENMALGLGQGWDSEYDRIKRNIEGGMNFGTASVDFASSGLGRSQSGLSGALNSMAATMGQNFTITVQSVLDGKVIGETAYQYSRNKQRAYGM